MAPNCGVRSPLVRLRPQAREWLSFRFTDDFDALLDNRVLKENGSLPRHFLHERPTWNARDTEKELALVVSHRATGDVLVLCTAPRLFITAASPVITTLV